jgi:hypothetical protein
LRRKIDAPFSTSSFVPCAELAISQGAASHGPERIAMKALPIRVRLSLWYFAMFASAAILLSLTSLWMLRRSVDATEYHELQERAEDVQLVLQP